MRRKKIEGKRRSVKDLHQENGPSEVVRGREAMSKTLCGRDEGRRSEIP